MLSTSQKLALFTSATLALTTLAPVDALAQRRGGGWHGGGGGWHGGGWHGGGGGWHGGSSWVGPAVAAGIGGLALGALAAGSAYPYYGYGYGYPAYGYGPAYYGGCTWRRGATYDAWGRFIGYGRVRVCY